MFIAALNKTCKHFWRVYDIINGSVAYNPPFRFDSGAPKGSAHSIDAFVSSGHLASAPFAIDDSSSDNSTSSESDSNQDGDSSDNIARAIKASLKDSKATSMLTTSAKPHAKSRSKSLVLGKKDRKRSPASSGNNTTTPSALKKQRVSAAATRTTGIAAAVISATEGKSEAFKEDMKYRKERDAIADKRFEQDWLDTKTQADCAHDVMMAKLQNEKMTIKSKERMQVLELKLKYGLGGNQGTSGQGSQNDAGLGQNGLDIFGPY